jgi:hypothetical protein
VNLTSVAHLPVFTRLKAVISSSLVRPISLTAGQSMAWATEFLSGIGINGLLDFKVERWRPGDVPFYNVADSRSSAWNRLCE